MEAVFYSVIGAVSSSPHVFIYARMSGAQSWVDGSSPSRPTNEGETHVCLYLFPFMRWLLLVVHDQLLRNYMIYI